jgi:type IV pilus assembly protein PilM
MAKRSIGLDIGTNAVRAAEIRHGATPTVTRLGQVALANGAVVEGEVIEPGDVASALRSLWKDAQFEGKSVRVGVAPSRAIVRTIEMPDIPDNELRQVIGYELSDHVPLEPSETTFGILPLDRIETSSGIRRRVLLAAAPLSAVNPMVETIKQAGLKVEAVDVGPLALSRAFRSAAMMRADGTSAPSVDAIISIGGETLLATIAEGGNMLFNRKAVSQAGSALTSRIQEQMSITAELAEITKRRIITNDSRHLVASVNTMTLSVMDEIADEIQESIEYYVSQLNSRPVDRILLTGGGSLLPGLDRTIATRTGYPTFFGDPFEGFDFQVPGLEVTDCAFVSTFVASAIGYALGGADGAAHMDIQQRIEKNKLNRSKVVLIAVGVASLAGMGYLYMGAGSDVSAAQEANAKVVAETQTIQEQVTKLRADSEKAGALTKGQMKQLVKAGEGLRIDWPASYAGLDTLSSPLGVVIKNYSGLSTLGTGAAAVAPTADGAAPDAPDVPAVVAPPGTRVVGSVSFDGVAPSLDAIAAWTRTVEADPRYSDVNTPSAHEEFDGNKISIGFTFSADLKLTDAALVALSAAAVSTDAAAAVPIDPATAQTTVATIPGAQP